MEHCEEVARYKKILGTWFNMYWRFIWAHYIMSGLAVILSVIQTTNLKDYDHLHPVFAAILAVDAGLIALFGAEKKANQAQRAWRILGVELDRFKAGTSSLENVISAYEKGEDIIHEAQPTPNKQPTIANGQKKSPASENV